MYLFAILNQKSHLGLENVFLNFYISVSPCIIIFHLDTSSD